MSTGAIRSRSAGLGTYASALLEDKGSVRRAPDFSAQLAARSAELRMSAWSGAGRLSLAQGVQLGVAAAQAGLAASQILEADPATLAKGAAPVPGEPGSGAADARRRSRGAEGRGTVPAGLADLMALAPEAASASRASGSDLQAWLDIATGRAALQAAEEMRGRGQTVREEPPAGQEPIPRVPDEGMASDRQPASRPATGQLPEETESREPMPPEPADAPVGPQAAAQTPLRATLEQARRSFGAALERLDAQLEPALAAAVARLGGADPSEVATSAASRMRQEPERAVEGHAGSALPGILELLKWDLTPLTDPLPEAVPARR